MGNGVAISQEQKQSFIDAWANATSFNEAFEMSDINVTDGGGRRRIRRSIEQEFGIKLDAHNPEYSTREDNFCPSTLDIRKAKKSKSFIVTSYMNNTTLIQPFLETLELLANDKDSQLLIKPLRYKNPNAMTRDEGYVWNSRIFPYAFNEDFHVNANLVFSGVSLGATSVNPLSGKQIAYGNKSVVYGHSQLSLDSVGTPKNELPKLLFSTGCINHPKYSNSNAGSKAKASHCNSALFFIKVGAKYRFIELEWDGSGVYFFDEYWTPEGKEKAKYSALHLGDTHAEGVLESDLVAREKVIKKLNPESIIWNDLHNQGSQSHHNTLIDAIKRVKSGTWSVEDEIEKSVKIVNRLGKGRKNLIIRSNHHDHLEQWMNRFDPRKDHHNAEYYFWLMGETVKTNKCALEIAMKKYLKVDYEFVDGDRKKLISGIDVSQHGDKGVDGSRSAVSLMKIGYKIQGGHSHKLQIKNGYWSSGTMALELGYNQGFSTWSNADTLISETGTRAHVTYIKGKYWV